MRRAFSLVKLSLCLAGAVAIYVITIASGSCGDCITQRVRMCDESVCGPHPACFGACECEEWNWRDCAGNGDFCEGTM